MKRSFLCVNAVSSILLTLFSFSGCATKTGPKISPAPPAAAQIESGAGTSELDLFNGKDLGGWRATDFGGHGEIIVRNDEIRIGMGAELSGIHWTNTAVLPKTNYEIQLDAMKLEGSDFFCGLTFPVNNSFCTLILGGWGGNVVGISSLDGADASENDTSKSSYFAPNRWYHVRLRVTPDNINAWVDGESFVDVKITGRKVAMRAGEIENSIPLGIATWQTSTALKNLKLKRL